MQDALRLQVRQLTTENKSLTQTFFANTIDVTSGTLNNWVNGYSNLEYTRLHKLKKVVDLFLYDLQ